MRSQEPRYLCRIKICGGPALAKGICAAHYRRKIKTGSVQAHLPIKRRVWGSTVAKTPEFRAWANMRYRCSNPEAKEFPRYGGRGIKVTPRWDSFDIFLADMGKRLSPKHSLERIDNNKGYGPNNCKWATSSEQMSNRSTSVRPAEKQKILNMRATGYSYRAIARISGRSPMTVWRVLRA